MAYEPSFVAGAQDYPNDAPGVYFVVKREGAWVSYPIAVDEHSTCLYSAEDIVEWSANAVFYLSIDGGVTWTPIVPSPVPYEPYKLSATQPAVFFGSDATDILVSDNLATWSISHVRGVPDDFYPRTGFASCADDQDRIHTVGPEETESLGDGLYRYYHQYVRSDDNCASVAIGPVDIFSMSTFHYPKYDLPDGHSTGAIRFHGIAANGHDVFAVFIQGDTWYEYNMSPGPQPIPPSVWRYTQHNRSRLCLAYSHDDGATWNSTVIWETCRDEVHTYGGWITYPLVENIYTLGYGSLITLCPSQNELFVGCIGEDLYTGSWGYNVIHRFKSTNIRSGAPTFTQDIAQTTFDEHEYGMGTLQMPQIWDDTATAFMISYYLQWLYDVEDLITYLAHTPGGYETALTLQYKDDYWWEIYGDIPTRALSGKKNRSFWW